MVAKIHLWPQPAQYKDDEVQMSYLLESESAEPQLTWFRLSQKYAHALTDSCDAYLLGALFVAMRRAADLVVHGTVSPSLLQNLEEFMRIWNCWMPRIYQPIEILADEEQETDLNSEKGVMTVFSGGVDSCFTVWRHTQGLAGRQSRSIHAGIFLHGFDIPLREQNIYAHAAEKAERMLNSLGIPLIRMATNLKKTAGEFADTHGMILAAAMTLLKKGYSVGFIPSTFEYNYMTLPFGSNPITDPLFSSHSMHIIHDGAAFSRTYKVETIASWSEAIQHLRVCFTVQNGGENCCKCEKCVRTILEFRLVGIPRPACFARDASITQVLGLNFSTQSRYHHYRSIIEYAHDKNVKATWFQALKLVYVWNLVKYRLKRSPATWRRQ